jgi:hypothetical protein
VISIGRYTFWENLGTNTPHVQGTAEPPGPASPTGAAGMPHGVSLV